MEASANLCPANIFANLRANPQCWRKLLKTLICTYTLHKFTPVSNDDELCRANVCLEHFADRYGLVLLSSLFVNNMSDLFVHIYIVK